MAFGATVTDAGAIQVALMAEDRTRRGATSAKRSLDDYAKYAEKVGKRMTLALTVPLAGFAAGAVKSAASFETSMTKIEALVGRSKAEVAGLSESVKALATETGQPLNKLAEAMFFVTSAGFSAAEAEKVLENAAKAAAAGMGEVEPIVNAVTRAIKAWGAENLSAAHAQDVLTKAVEQGQLDAEQLARQLPEIASGAAEAGIEIEELTGALAFMSRQMTLTQAKTGLRQFILSFVVNPAASAVKELEKAGLSIESWQEMVSENLTTAMDHIKRLGDEGVIDIRKFLGGSQEARLFWDSFVGDNANLIERNQVLAEMGKAVGKTDRAYAAGADTLERRWNKAVQESKVALVEVGTDLLPVVADALEDIADLVSQASGVWNELDDSTKKVVGALALVVAGAGPVLFVLGKLVRVLAVLRAQALLTTAAMGPLGLIMAAVALAAGQMLMEEIKAAARTAELREKVDELSASMGVVEEDTGVWADRLREIRDLLDENSDAHAGLAKEIDSKRSLWDKISNLNVLESLANMPGGDGDLFGWDPGDAYTDTAERVAAATEAALEQAELAWRDAERAASSYIAKGEAWAAANPEIIAAQEALAETLDKTTTALQDQAEAFDAASAAAEKEARALFIAIRTGAGNTEANSRHLAGLAHQLSKIDELEMEWAAWRDAISATTDATEDHTDALRDQAEAFDATRAAAEKETKALLVAGFATRGTHYTNMGPGTRLMELREELKEMAAVQAVVDQWFDSIGESAKSTTRTFEDQRTALEKLADSYGEFERSLSTAMRAMRASRSAERALIMSRIDALDSLDRLQDSITGPVGQIEEAKQELAEFEALLRAQGRRAGSKKGEMVHLVGQQKEHEKLKKRVATLSGEVENMTSVFDLNSKAGRRNMQAFIESAEAVAEWKATLMAAGFSAHEAEMKVAPLRAQLEEMALEAGAEADMVARLVDKFGDIPDDVSTLIDANTEPATQKIRTLEDLLCELTKPRKIVITTVHNTVGGGGGHPLGTDAALPDSVGWGPPGGRPNYAEDKPVEKIVEEVKKAVEEVKKAAPTAVKPNWDALKTMHDAGLTPDQIRALDPALAMPAMPAPTTGTEGRDRDSWTGHGSNTININIEGNVGSDDGDEIMDRIERAIQRGANLSIFGG